MDTGILISVRLAGQLGPPVAHTTKELFSADISPIGSKKSEIITRKIKHTSRTSMVCIKQIHISPEIVNYWQSSDCPMWSQPNVWRKLSKQQRIQSYVSTFNEGYGVNYE